MNKRQPPIVRAGSGDSHEARLAVLEQRFSDEMQARCSWCNDVTSAKQGEWLEVIISSPGTGVRPAHVFRCFGCDRAPAEVSGGIVTVPSGGRRPGQSPPRLPSDPSADKPDARVASATTQANRASSAPPSTRKKGAAGEARRSNQNKGNAAGRGATRQGKTGPGSSGARPRRQAPVFSGSLSPAP